MLIRIGKWIINTDHIVSIYIEANGDLVIAYSDGGSGLLSGDNAQALSTWLEENIQEVKSQ